MTSLSLTQMAELLRDKATIQIGYTSREGSWMQLWFLEGEMIAAQRNGELIPNEQACIVTWEGITIGS